MTDLYPYDYERILIGYVITYEDAAKYVLPQLTHNMFIYSQQGSFSGSKDHQRIWQAVTTLHFVDRLPTTSVNIAMKLGESGKSGEFLSYLKSLELSLAGYYRIREFNVESLMKYAERVDVGGVAYRAGASSYKIAKIIDSPEAFNKEVSAITDVTVWLKNFVSDVSSIIVPKAQGYEHISTAVDKAQQIVDRIHRGEQLTLLPCGLPSLHLPLGKLVVLMGESNAGKSIVAHQAALGAAIGLQRYGLKGCIGVNSLEEDSDSFTLKLAGMLSAVDLFQFKYGMGISDNDKYKLDKALEYVATLPIYLDPTNMIASSVMDFRMAGLHASEAGPVWHLTVDYMELFDLNAEKTDNKEGALDQIVHKGFQISRQTGANVLFISQVTQGNSGNSRFRIAGPDGTRYSKAIRHAADIIYEFYNPIELKRSGIDFSVPSYLNEKQPWMLCTKHRGGPKYDPAPMGWQPTAQRIFDTTLNREGSSEIVLFDHPIPSFEELGF